MLLALVVTIQQGDVPETDPSCLLSDDGNSMTEAVTELMQYEDVFMLGFEYNPMRCALSAGDAEQCGGSARGQCVTPTHVYDASQFGTDDDDQCFWLAFAVATSSADDGICLCRAPFEGVRCGGCALGWEPDEGLNGCTPRAPFMRRALATEEPAFNGAIEAALVPLLAEEDVSEVNQTAAVYSHTTALLTYPCTRLAPTNPHTSEWFLLWHRVYYANVESTIVAEPTLAELLVSTRGEPPPGLPYLNVMDANAGEIMWSVAPGLAFEDRGVACRPYSLLEYIAASGFDVVTALGEEEIVRSSTFAEFMDAVASLHVASLCWFASIGYTSEVAVPPAQQMQGVTNACRFVGGADTQGTTAIRSNLGRVCGAWEDEGEVERDRPTLYSEATQAPAVLLFHLYLDALLEKWQLLHGHSACDELQAARAATSRSAGTFAFSADHCLSQQALNHFNFSCTPNEEAQTAAGPAASSAMLMPGSSPHARPRPCNRSAGVRTNWRRARLHV